MKGVGMKRASLFLGIFFCTHSLYTWNNFVHCVVAQIAYNHLIGPVKSKVDIISQRLADYEPVDTCFMQGAMWADAMRDDDVRARLWYNWHFFVQAYDPHSVMPDTQKKVVEATQKNNNVVWAVENIINAFKKPFANILEEMVLLRLFTHFVGDAHQPFHCVTRFSDRHKIGDRGANSCMIFFEGVEFKLHVLWDNALLQYDRALDMNKKEYVIYMQQVANEIEQEFPINAFEYLSLTPADWAKEGYEYAVEQGYNLQEGHELSDAYKEYAKLFARKRIAQAGYRLALLLNSLFIRKRSFTWQERNNVERYRCCCGDFQD